MEYKYPQDLCKCVCVCVRRDVIERAQFLYLILACACSEEDQPARHRPEREEGGMTSAGRKKGRGGLARSTLKAILCPSFMSVFWTPSTEEDQYSSTPKALFHFIHKHTHFFTSFCLNISISNRHHVCQERHPRPHWTLLKPSQEVSRHGTVSKVE